MQVVVVVPPVGQTVNQPRVAVEGEDDRLVGREQLIEIPVAQPVRVLARRLQAHQVDHVDHADFQRGQMLAHERDRRERLERRHVAAAGHDDIGRRRRPRCSAHGPDATLHARSAAQRRPS